MSLLRFHCFDDDRETGNEKYFCHFTFYMYISFVLVTVKLKGTLSKSMHARCKLIVHVSFYIIYQPLNDSSKYPSLLDNAGNSFLDCL